MGRKKIAPSDHPTGATLLAHGATMKQPCVYCGNQYRSEPCGAAHAQVRMARRRARLERAGKEDG